MIKKGFITLSILLSSCGLANSQPINQLPVVTPAGGDVAVITHNYTGNGTGTTANATLSSILNLLNLSNPVTINQGGTGANTLAGAQTALGVGATGNKCPNINAYGGSGNGVTDNTAAWNAVIAAQSASQICIAFGSGTYYFASAVSVTAAATGSVYITGAGADVTVLDFNSGVNGITVNYTTSSSSATIKDLTLATKGVNAGTALSLVASAISVPNQAQTNVSEVSIRGADAYAGVDYWAIGIYNYGVRWVNFTNDIITGGGGCTAVTDGCYYTGTSIGAYITGTATLVPVQFNFVNDSFNYVGTGIYYGSYAQGVIVQNCAFVGGNYGILTQISETGLDQLTVQGNNINVGSEAIDLQTAVPNTTITNNTFLVAPSSVIDSSPIGVDLSQSNNFSIVANAFQSLTGAPAGNYGVVVVNSGTAGSITGNSFWALNTAVWLKSGASFVNDWSNAYNSNTTNVTNSGTSNSIYLDSASPCSTCVGYYTSSNIASTSAISIATSGLTYNVTSLALTPGNWNVCGSVWWVDTSTTVATILNAGINTSSAVLPTAPIDGVSRQGWNGSITGLGLENFVMAPQCVEEQLTSNTTIYLVASATFSASTVSAYGSLWATLMP